MNLQEEVIALRNEVLKLRAEKSVLTVELQKISDGLLLPRDVTTRSSQRGC